MPSRVFSGFRPMLRGLARTPGYTLFVILTFAVGIGSTTAVFTVADAFLFKPLPFPQPSRLVMLHERAPGNTTVASPVSTAAFLDFRSRTSSYEQIAGYEQLDFNLSTGGDQETVYCAVSTANFFDVLGIRPVLGRAFAAGEDTPGNNQVVVLSYGLWERRFAADPGIVGRKLKLSGAEFTVIGVMGKSMRFPLGSDLWTPLAFSPAEKQVREWRHLHLLARLKPGVPESQARAELQTIANDIAKAYPQSNQGWSVIVQMLDRYLLGEFNREYTLLLMGAVFFVLLIVCANVMSLQYARISGRRKEFGVRAALGAGRWSIARQIVGEGLVLSLAGAVASLLFSSWSLSLILSHMPSDVARYIAGWDAIQLDGRALVFTLAVAICSGILSGLIPALRTRPDINDALKEGARGTSAGLGRLRSRGVLVVAQISVATVLLAGAGLMLRGSRALVQINQNFRPSSVLTMQISLSDKHYGSESQRAEFWDSVLERLGALPGVQAATLVSNPPYGSNDRLLPYWIEGQPVANPSEQRSAQVLSVSPNYLEMLGIPMLEGRRFLESDGSRSMPVAIVSENFAQHNWTGKDAIGRRFRLSAKGEWLTVVGVAKDVRYDPWVAEIAPTIYQPYRQSPLYYTYIAIRAQGNPYTLAAPVRRTIAAIDVDRPLWEVKTLDRIIAENLIGLMYVAAMLAVLSAIATMLSAAGIYGLMAYTVAERTREIGIRLALGAAREDVLRMLGRRGLLLTLLGIGIGLAVSIPLARLLSSLIFGVGANDFVTFSGAAILLGLAALLACYIPARRAMSVDPIIALRQD